MGADELSTCIGCATTYDAWITTCPACNIPVRGDDQGSLSDEVAAPVNQTIEQWIDIPISANQPAEAALLAHFLRENKFPFEQSRRFFSVPRIESDRLTERTELWAFHHELPPDERVRDSLDGTLREIGEIVMLAIAAATAAASGRGPASGIDLRK